MSLGGKQKLPSTKANVPNIHFPGLPCRLCQSDASVSPTPPLDLDSGVIDANNKAFKESILVRVTAAAIFQSLKSTDKFSGCITTWIQISRPLIKSPLLWIYALWIISELQTLFPTYFTFLHKRRALTSVLHWKRNNLSTNEYTGVLIFLNKYLMSLACIRLPQPDPVWEN